jgi:hypothetical protein
MKGDAFFDFRNIYNGHEAADHGFRHFPVGIGLPNVTEQQLENSAGGRRKLA